MTRVRIFGGYRTIARGLAVAIAATMLTTAGTAFAEDEDAPRRQRGPRDPERMQKILDKFDTDGDGKLSQEERAALREEMGGRRGARGAGGEQGARRGERGARGGERGARGGEGARAGRGGGMNADPGSLFDRIDEDNDGQVTKQQFVAFMEKMRGEMRARRGERGPGQRGPGQRGEGRRRARPEAELN